MHFLDYNKAPSLNFSISGIILVLCINSKSESENEVAQSRPTLCDPIDCSLPGSSVRGIFQAIVLE